MTRYFQISSPLGDITLASDVINLTGLWFFDQKYFPEGITYDQENNDALSIFKETKAWLSDYFSGKNPGPLPPLAPAGTDFRQKVWQTLLTISYGSTQTYSQVAKKLEADGYKNFVSPRAVGGAVGHNPISILIPCHRVLGAKGQLTGYAGGLERKTALLQLEGAIESLS